jgi:hypothetical protein
LLEGEARLVETLRGKADISLELSGFGFVLHVEGEKRQRK